MGVVLLVRHGQASWGSDDYDVLSEVGHEQAALLGAALAARGVVPDRVLRGSMRRHRETAEGLGAAAGIEVDPGWDEFDGAEVFLPTPWAAGHEPSVAEYDAWFDGSMDRWTGGGHDADYAEPFGAFTDRVDQALRRATAYAGTTLVVTSGGPVGWALAGLLGARLDHAGRVALSRTLNPLCVNTGVAKVLSGRRGLSAVQFNEHTHLESRPELITYR